VDIDGKKKTEGGKLHLRPHSREKSGSKDKEAKAKESKEDKEEEIYSEDSQDSESEGHSSENYEPSESGSDAETNYSENESDAEGSISSVNRPLKSPAKEMRKRPKRETKKDKKPIKKRRTEKLETDEKIEIKHEETKKPEEGEKEEKKGGGKKKETPIFNDKNVDFDLFNSSPSNVVSRKIKVSNNLMVTCRMIDQTEGKSSLTYDYAALTIQRKTANEKMFEFIIPLSLTPRIIEAMKIIVDENKKFFKPQNDNMTGVGAFAKR